MVADLSLGDCTYPEGGRAISLRVLRAPLSKIRGRQPSHSGLNSTRPFTKPWQRAFASIRHCGSFRGTSLMAPSEYECSQYVWLSRGESSLPACFGSRDRIRESQAFKNLLIHKRSLRELHTYRSSLWNPEELAAVRSGLAGQYNTILLYYKQSQSPSIMTGLFEWGRWRSGWTL
jgi:hypothetical protein